MNNDRDYLLNLQSRIFPNKQNSQFFLKEWEKTKAGFLDGKIEYKPIDFCNSFDITIEQFNKLTGPSYKDLTNRKILLDPFLKTIDIKVYERLKNVIVGTLPKISLNAETYTGPFGTPIIVFHDGLTWLIEHFKYVQTFKIEENHSDFSRKYYLKELKKLQSFYIANGRQNEKFTKIDMSTDSLLKSSIQVQFIKLFIYAHEYAHIYCNHLIEKEKDTIELRLLDKIESAELKSYNLNQIMEFEADELAYKWFKAFLKSESELVSYAKEFNMNHIETLPFEFLYILNLFQSPLIINETNSEEHTHPSSLDRLRRLFDINKLDLSISDIKKTNEMIFEAEKQVQIFSEAKKILHNNRKH